MRTRTILTAATLAAGLATPAPAAVAAERTYEVLTYTASPRTGDDVEFHLYIGVDTQWEMDVDGDGFDDGTGRSPVSAAPVAEAVARFASGFRERPPRPAA